MLAKLTVSSTSNLPPNNREIETHSPLETVSIVLVGFVVLSVIAAAIYEHFYKRNKPSLRPKLSAKISCQECYYFSCNHYVKCAIHPDNVLTDRAINCRDYSSSN
jgi:Tfp pilus assembly protein PilE